MEILQVRNWENGGGSKSALPPIVPRSCKGILGLIEGRHYLRRSHPGDSPPETLYFFRYLLVSHLLNPSMLPPLSPLPPPSFQSETVEPSAPFETAEQPVTALPKFPPNHLPQILAMTHPSSSYDCRERTVWEWNLDGSGAMDWFLWASSSLF